ncbi:hypothetical protein C2E21_4376 [Chlorella sorokiniana]|uniref:Uncharacterized protein n=1 Tax=Chlorella sorokiniana TaxID=3076 RepID=A0A2P6TTB7_CHLSO|nr:hypothetical protein C2E21_4376 [Chlorella sorokiniana]|eukprot:PRW57294.1 hypothetical protein C2E21_4376 [Chlorella sorokiniana]
MEGSLAAAVLQGRGSEAPRGCSLAEDEEELHLDAGEELCPGRQLCGALAAAVVTHSPPPTNITPPAGVSAFSLALAGDEPGTLVHLPVMERGQLLTSPLEPAGSLPADSAAWAAYEAAAGGGGGGGRGQAAPPLVWHGSDDSEPPTFPDWRALLESETTEGSSPPAALVTVPIVAPGGAAPLGAATFVLAEAPSQGQLDELAALGACLACSIAHQTKNLWEESLGFLNSVIPRRVVQRMLSAALSLGPLAAAAAPLPEAAAAVAAAVVAEAAGAELPAAEPSTPASGGGGAKLRRAAPATPLSPSGGWKACSPLAPAEPAEPAEPDAAPAGLAHPASPLGAHAAAPPAFAGPSTMAALAVAELSPERLAFGSEPAVAAEIKTLRQKWNLEFADPLLEESYKLWFNTMQTQTDLQAFRYFSVLLLLLFAALLLRGGMTLGDFLAVAHGVLSVAALGVLMLLNTPWYVAHRSLVVASVRIASAALLLLHVYLDPCFYSGSMLKGLAGSCALTLLIAPLRNRLRFSNHLLVQLAKLNLCGLTNSFMYADPQRAQRTQLPLLTTTLIQLGAALLPSMLVYRMESSQRW